METKQQAEAVVLSEKKIGQLSARCYARAAHEKELQVLETKIDYHKNRALHYLSCLAEKHTGANREDLLKLMELLPLFLPQFTAEQP